MNIKGDLLTGKGCATLLKTAGNRKNYMKSHKKFVYLKNTGAV
jgi:hypothetical protein